jgi:ribosomal protein L37AE/L43A
MTCRYDECNEPRCPECSGREFREPTPGWHVCIECGIGAPAGAWEPTECTCDEIADSRAQDEAEAMIDAMEGYGYAA